LYDLLKQRVQLGLDQAEAQTLLERRKQAANNATEQVRKEIDGIQERLAVLAARRKALDDELDGIRGELRRHTTNSLEAESAKEEVAQIEEAQRKVGAEVEALGVDLNAPTRIRLIENASPPAK
jgi:hypothetical protein